MDERYPMGKDQLAQIDCRVTSCRFCPGAGQCVNISPAITLNPNGTAVCWSKTERTDVELEQWRLNQENLHDHLSKTVTKLMVENLTIQSKSFLQHLWDRKMR